MTPEQKFASIVQKELQEVAKTSPLVHKYVKTIMYANEFGSIEDMANVSAMFVKNMSKTIDEMSEVSIRQEQMRVHPKLMLIEDIDSEK